MNKHAPEIQTNRASASKVQRLLLAVTVVATIGGCAGGIQEDPSGANAVTVKPGQTANCATSPCAISLVMPAGSGSYEVTGNSVTIGTYPAGKRSISATTSNPRPWPSRVPMCLRPMSTSISFDIPRVALPSHGLLG